MSNAVLDNSRISKHLGQTSQYKSTYDADLLVREPRSNNRQHINVQDDDLPFVGYDIWNAYEVSGLTENGLPISAVAKVVYNCNSKYIVESKSIKLYFNSFNMYKCGRNSGEALRFIEDTATADLSKLLETDVKVYLLQSHMIDRITANKPCSVFNEQYATLENQYQVNDQTFEYYSELPDLLQVTPRATSLREDYSLKVHSGLLKSNCRVTSQPDWGDVYIHMEGSGNTPCLNSLLKYIVSFRDECHFHEEICETIYVRLRDRYTPDKLAVTCLYARRGGIDINPCRASDTSLLPVNLIDATIPHIKTAKQ